jgi:arabinose-5-phosphate isomerase
MDKKLIIKSAREAIKNEISGIKKLSTIIDDNFSKILVKLSKVKGKIIFTGIGKSAHIAQKISSTMSSTGTPSQFYHSTEMSHGDLGAISKNDLIIILSNSGNSVELNGIIEFCSKNNISTIGISSNKNSNLIKSSPMSLIIPSANEACSIGLAPTTSTSMMLVLGDAICVSLMKIKKFTVKNYREIHPGGSLGESLLQVKKIMHSGKKIPQIDENDSMKNAILEITRKSFGHVIVTNKSSKIVGIITDGDLRRAMNKNLLDKKVSLIMNRNPFVIKEDLLCQKHLV